MDRAVEPLFTKKVPVTIKSALGLGSHGHCNSLGMTAGSAHLGASTTGIAYSPAAASVPTSVSLAAPTPAGVSAGIGGLAGLRIHTGATTSLGSTPHEGSHYQEKKHPSITIQVAMSAKNGGRFKTLEIQLTDEADPYFLYHLDIAEDDFHALRSQQNLLVDFNQFPIKFIELLEECILGTHEEHPKFLAHLSADINSRYATFSIVETNSFKHINHLSLQFVPGTDAAVKQYLASLVNGYKIENAMLKDRLADTDSSLTTKIHDSQSTVTRLTSELDQLKLAYASQGNQLRLEHVSELSKEREVGSHEREMIRIQNEGERREMERKHAYELSSLQQKLATVTAAHSDMMQHTQSLETTLLAANKDNSSLSYENKKLTQDIDRISTAAQNSQRQCDELESSLKAEKERTETMERKQHDADLANSRLQDQLGLLQDQQKKANESLELYKSHNVRFEESMKKATEEITKGNDIIRRLQAELKTTKTKLKLKNVKEVATAKETLSKKNEDSESLRLKIDELTKKLEEGKAIIVDNNHVIEWLHKQLNDEALHRPLTSTLAGGGVASGVDFEKYAGMAMADRSKQRSPTATYRSRYIPQDTRATSPAGPLLSLHRHTSQQGQSYHQQGQHQTALHGYPYHSATRTATSPSPGNRPSGISATGNGLPASTTGLTHSVPQQITTAVFGVKKSPSTYNSVTNLNNTTPPNHLNSGSTGATLASFGTRQTGMKSVVTSHPNPSSYF
ncbi:hypothetical protein BASA83_010078 [Batrachochytrium salamandrivorans]|nr:hypothetical protein BASA83_010078 [Batrachochytrium salamandrivorans]